MANIQLFGCFTNEAELEFFERIKTKFNFNNMGFDKSVYNKFNFDREYQFINDYSEVAGR